MGSRRKRQSVGNEKEEGSASSVDKMNQSMNLEQAVDGESKTDLNEKTQEVMKSNLDLMLEVVMQIREDDDFAASIYDDCPRLQHLLDQHPDLRPVFEDPKLVRINFEQVYRNAGGVLPEDPPPKRQRIKKCIAVVVNHPLFKVLRVLLIVKKIFTCITGGGMSLARNCFRAAFCCSEPTDLVDGDVDGDGEGSPENRANKEALNKAADHMEQPEVQEKMNEILAQDDPEALEEAVENDKELKALKESNPLCAEIMADPDTMRILTDPDNLRALGEAPDLIDADFADPDWVSPDDLEARGSLGVMETVPEELDGDYDFDQDFDAEEPEEELEGEEDEEEGFVEEFEMGDEGNDNNNTNKSRSANSKNKKKQQKNDENQGGGGGGGFMSNLASGLTDYVAGELVGATLGDITGGGDELGGLEDVDAPVDDIPVDDVAEAAEEQGTALAETAVGAMEAAEALTEGDALDNLDTLEEQMDMVEEQHENAADKDKSGQTAAIGVAAGGTAVAGAAAMGSRSMGDDEEEDDDEPTKKKRFGFIGTGLSAITSAAKEHVATAFLGDDLGEMLVEKVEESDDEDEDSSDPPKESTDEKVEQ